MAIAAVRRAELRVERDMLLGGRLILEIEACVLKLKLIDTNDGYRSPTYTSPDSKCWRHIPMSPMFSVLASRRLDVELSSNELYTHHQSEATRLRLSPWPCPDRYAGVKLSQAFLEEDVSTQATFLLTR